ncbi:MAG: hydrolase [Alphaproteobacteria bacterium]|nr:hydrolase [Alphaproteobacteria bacterium]MBU1516636.1 hydrolase [Alphaproteobacteria bacterium]MBU2094392.1 hydrolase [Alphaproteobacteria bacterium]MBU2153277.1 hydrolase [Alphaproteobacteria bacterium]MBU2307563.1 hydrolase [Alphaproteobacteria bacterium]
MTSFSPLRDPATDHLLTPQNAALVIIDFQPVQVSSIQSIEKRTLVANIIAVARTAKLYGLPTVLSTVNVATGRNQPIIHQLAEVFPEIAPIDRTSINAWEDADFVAAVRATGRKKLIFAALWTEVCLVHPALDALSEGFEVYPVVDAVGGTSRLAHDAGLQRLIQAGAKPTSWVQLICELQRDWNRAETLPGFSEILFAVEGH